MKRYGSDLAPQELLDEAAKILAKDKARLAGSNYPVYKGPTTAPMSSLTQRARTLKEGFAKKPAPYTKKLEKVLNRSNEGVSPATMAQQLSMLQQGQENFNTNTVLGALRNQFRSSYAPRVPQFLDQSQRDLTMGTNKFSSGFGDLSKASGALEQSSNQQLVEALKELQSQKEARREGLTGMMEQFGAQKHGYTNLANQAQRNLFNEEAAAPYKRMELLRQGLGSSNENMGDETHPDIQKQSGKEALNALRAYGIDVSKPVEEWDAARTAPPTYKGKLMADLPPEILASHSTLEAVSPKFKDTLYDKRKALLGQLMGDESVAGKALTGIPERMRGPISALEEEARRKLQKDMGSINARYIRKNMYGSSAHLKASEERAQEVARATFEERNRLLEDAMKSGLALEHQGQIGNLRQLGQYGAHGQKEFGDSLGNIRNMNKLGSTKWGNEQAENEELYKNYQNEAAWEWPHLRGQAQRHAYGDVFRGLDNRGISLDQLAGINTRYSELEKENLTRRAELDTRDKTINDLYGQLGVFEKQRGNDSMNQRFLDATRESDDATNWWNTTGSKSGDSNANWKRVEAARAKLAAAEKEVQAAGNYSQIWGQAVRDSSARHAGYNKAWDANLAQKASEETARLEALRNPMTRFNQMSPIEQHAYRNYNTEAEYAANQDNFLKQHFAGQHAGYGARGNTLPWRVPESQRQAFWASQ